MPSTRRWMRHTALAALALTALAACENGKFRSTPLIDYGRDLVGLGKDKAPPPPEATTTIGPPLFVGFGTTRVALPGVGERGQSRYYVAADGAEIAMNNGILTRAIGLGLDLQGMYLAPDSPYLGNLAAAARAEETTERVADYYRQGRIVHDTYRCALSYTPRDGNRGKITELCRRFFGNSGFRNTYWTEGDRIVCSIQWFHPDAERLQFFETAEQAQSLDLRRQDC